MRPLAMIALAIAGVFAGPASASPSFDCNKAQLPDERAICGNFDLSELDKRIASAFNESVRKFGKKEAIRFQRYFLQFRRKCKSDVSCILDAQRQVLNIYRNNAILLRDKFDEKETATPIQPSISDKLPIKPIEPRYNNKMNEPKEVMSVIIDKLSKWETIEDSNIMLLIHHDGWFVSNGITPNSGKWVSAGYSICLRPPIESSEVTNCFIFDGKILSNTSSSVKYYLLRTLTPTAEEFQSAKTLLNRQVPGSEAGAGREVDPSAPKPPVTEHPQEQARPQTEMKAPETSNESAAAPDIKGTRFRNIALGMTRDQISSYLPKEFHLEKSKDADSWLSGGIQQMLDMSKQHGSIEYDIKSGVSKCGVVGFDKGIATVLTFYPCFFALESINDGKEFAQIIANNYLISQLEYEFKVESNALLKVRFPKNYWKGNMPTGERIEIEAVAGEDPTAMKVWSLSTITMRVFGGAAGKF